MLLGFLVWKKKLIIPGSALAAVLIALIIWAAALLTQKTFYKGVLVEGIDLSGLNIIEARTLIENSLNEKYRGQTITLQYKDRVWTLKFNDISYKFLTGEALEKAYMAGRTGSIFNRLYRMLDMTFNNVSIACEADFDRSKLKSILSDIKKQVDKKEEDASIIFKNGNIQINKEVIGALLDIDTNLRIIENQVLKRNYHNIELSVKEMIPRVVYDDIKDLKHFISSFSTIFNAGDINRSDNIRLASERINNTLLLPGDIFSMDKALGPRTAENGYKEAPVIYKNELIKGPGGGVCQVTTTLYGAVLRAKVEVLERTPHSLPLGYVQPGQDATIAEAAIDFKIQNSYNYPIAILSEVKGNRLIIKILGKKSSEDYIIKIKSEIIEEYFIDEEDVTIDNSIPDGQKVVVQKARSGFKVVVYRDIYSKNGELLDREKISEDVYKPQKAQVKVNEDYYMIEDFGGQQYGDRQGTE